MSASEGFPADAPREGGTGAAPAQGKSGKTSHKQGRQVLATPYGEAMRATPAAAPQSTR